MCRIFLNLPTTAAFRRSVPQHQASVYVRSDCDGSGASKPHSEARVPTEPSRLVVLPCSVGRRRLDILRYILFRTYFS